MDARDLTPHDDSWPKGFADLGDEFHQRTPRFRGVLPPPTQPAVAIVGARKASEESLGFAHALAMELARHRVVVWSGGALGIDTAAHRGALEANGPTVAVLGGGLHHLSPPENHDLFARLVEAGGALLSPFDDDQPALPQGFIYRNRVLAAGAQALVVVECDIQSGARSAAAAARRLRRPVGVVPHAPWSRFGKGNLLELTRHQALPITSARDVLRVLGVEPIEADAAADAPRPVPPAVVRLVDPLAQQIHTILTASARHVDDIALATGRSASEVARALFELAVEGLARDAGAGNWCLVER